MTLRKNKPLLKKFNIPRRNKNDVVWSSKSWLEEKYWIEGLSVRDIAKECNTSYTNIIYHMKKHNIPRRNKSEATVGERNGMYGKTQTEEYKRRVSEQTKKFFEDPANRELWRLKSSGVNNGMYNKNHTAEARKKMSVALKKRWGEPGFTKKMSVTFKKAYKDNPEFKEAMSKRAKKRTGNKNPFYGKKHTPETCQIISEALIGKFVGEKGANWQGGKTKLHLTIRESWKYKKWRTLVFERDSYTCQFCDQMGGELQVDHIKPFSVIIRENNIISRKQALGCEELWYIDNGRTLCKPCHQTTDTYVGRANKY